MGSQVSAMRETVPLISLPIPAFSGVRVVHLADVAALGSNLSSPLKGGEQAVFASLASEKRKTSFVAGRVVARRCVVALLEVEGREREANDLEITRDPDGRPQVFQNGRLLDIAVSISHGGELAAAVAARGCRVGLDVEPVTEKAARLRERIASPEERALVEGAVEGGAALGVIYTRLFSAKEAMAKCRGSHLFHALVHYRVTAVEPERLWLEDASAPGGPVFGVVTEVYRDHVFSLFRAEPGP